MKRPGIPAQLLEDWPAKVISLALALFVFFVYNLTRLEQRALSIPLSVSLNDEVVPSTQYPRTVKVILRGERDTLYSLREDDIAAGIDLSGIRAEGAFRAPVRIERRGAAIAADPLELTPEPGEIVVGMERKATRSLPVTPSFRGFVDPGYELVSFDIEPPEVLVAGPAGAVARATDVATEFIELSGKRADFSLDARLLRKDSFITVPGADTVKFKARVRRALVSRTLDGLRIQVRGLNPSLALADPLPPGSMRLHAGGPDQGMGGTAEESGAAAAAAAAQAQLASQAQLAIDLSSFARPGTYTVRVDAAVPPGVFIETYEPQSVTVRLVSPEGS